MNNLYILSRISVFVAVHLPILRISHTLQAFPHPMEYLCEITLLSSHTKRYIMKEYNQFCSKIVKITKHSAYTHLRIGYNLIRKDCTIFEVYSLLFCLRHLCLCLFTADVNQLLRNESHYIRVVNYFPL